MNIKENMNKKGIIPILPASMILAIAVGVVILVFGLMFGFKVIFSTKYLVYGVGILILVLLFIYAVPAFFSGNASRGKTGVFLLLIFVGALFIILPSLGFFKQEILAVTTDVSVLGEGNRIRIAATPGSENTIVELSKDELNSKIEGQGWTVDKGVKIELQTLSFEERYTLVRQENEIFKAYDDFDKGNLFGDAFLFSRDSLIRNCRTKNSLPDTIDAYRDGASEGAFSIPNLHCVVGRTQGVGNVAHIDGQGSDEFVLKVTVSGEEPKQITRTDRDVSFAGGKINIHFVTSLSAAEYIKDIPFDILWQDSQFKHLITKNALARQNEEKNNYQSCIKILSSTISTKAKLKEQQSCISKYNNEIVDILSNQNDKFSPSVVEFLNFDSKDTNKGEMRAKLKSIKLPLLIIEVDGKFLGIEKLSGEPEILECVNDISTTSGRESEMKGELKIKNKGTNEGTFLINYKCDNPNIGMLLTSNVILQKGEEESLVATISGTSKKKGVTESARCKIIVTDRNSKKSDDCNFDVDIEFAEGICVPNQVSCSLDGTKVEKCNAEGDKVSTIKTCSDTQECDLKIGTGVTCVSKSLLDRISPQSTIVENASGKIDAKLESVRIKCDEKEESQPYLGWVYIESTEEVCGFLCTITGGVIAPKEQKKAECKATFLPYYVFSIVGVLVLLIVFMMMRRPQTLFYPQRQSRNYNSYDGY